MKLAKMIVIAAAVLAVAGVCSQAQLFFQVKVKGYVYMDGDKKPDRTKFGNDTVLGAFGVPMGDMVYYWDGYPGDEECFAVDGTDAFAGYLFYVEDFSCGSGETDTSSKSTTKATCVEMISLFDSDNIDGAATCDYTYTYDSNKDEYSLNKKCHIEAIVPSSEISDAPTSIEFWPIELDVSGGKALDIAPF